MCVCVWGGGGGVVVRSTLHPRTISFGFNWANKVQKKCSSEINLLFKNMVSMATNKAILKTEDTPTKNNHSSPATHSRIQNLVPN